MKKGIRRRIRDGIDQDGVQAVVLEA